ncbi:uncharacterized protein LOC142352197 [Convolutriloba macropyga]|uniref:uncharacterized protein LOC142352197 n=1 Tax=Convolutriloba macropyga TaxID=536237 RepID=UPI003F528C33
MKLGVLVSSLPGMTSARNLSSFLVPISPLINGKVNNIRSNIRSPTLPTATRPSCCSLAQSRCIHLTKRTEEIVTNPENAVWDPVREFYFRKYSLFETLGMDYEDKEADEFLARYFMFLGVSVIAMGLIFWSYYKPSYMRMVHDWGKREAFRLVEEREAAGLPVIDIDYAPVEELLPYLPPEWGMYTCDVESDFTWYDRVYQLYPAPQPTQFIGHKPTILGAFEEHQRVLNDGSKL